MIIINCKQDESGYEYIPDFTETELFNENEFSNISKKKEKIIMLYNAIVNQENYYYLNRPTAFGDPEYTRYQGIVTGILIGTGWDLVEIDGYIIISSGNKKILKIQKPKRNVAFFDAIKENNELLDMLGL